MQEHLPAAAFSSALGDDVELNYAAPALFCEALIAREVNPAKKEACGSPVRIAQADILAALGLLFDYPVRPFSKHFGVDGAVLMLIEFRCILLH